MNKQNNNLLQIVERALPFAVKKIYVKRKKQEELLDYWAHPDDGKNMPEEYLKGKERSIFLLNLIRKYIKKDALVLEIGCNVGRNLNELFNAGFNNLSGLEISKNAIDIMKTSYPAMAEKIAIFQGPVERIIQDFKDRSFDLVYTMAVLEHIHTDSEFIFSHMVRISRNLLITIEDEKGVSWRHFPRNYKMIFEGAGLMQIEEISLKKIKVPGLSSHFMARVFKK